MTILVNGSAPWAVFGSRVSSRCLSIGKAIKSSGSLGRFARFVCCSCMLNRPGEKESSGVAIILHAAFDSPQYRRLARGINKRIA